jgi:hypothetical protein
LWQGSAVVAAVTASLAIVAGCASSSGAQGTVADQTTPSELGTVTGVARMYGGPLVRRHGHWVEALDGAPADVTVTASAAPAQVYRTHTNARGRFLLQLPPGTYQLRTTCSLPVAVVVRPDATLRLPVSCPVP